MHETAQADPWAAMAQAMVHHPADILLTPLPPQARFIFRGGKAACAAASRTYGPMMPEAACTSKIAGQRAALWLGPDEFLLLAPAEDADAVEQAMARALCDLPHSLVDISHRNLALEISGPASATLLNAGCALDLSDTSFPPGACTRTLLGKAEILLWRTGPTRYHVEAWRSFAPYVWQFLQEARYGLS